jgi:SAM-dependent methyltransferase
MRARVDKRPNARVNALVTFAIPGAAYDDFMGRYSSQLAPLFADFCGVGAGAAVLDVGCGPGALTAVLVQRSGPARVAGIEPSPGFAEVCRARLPDADIRQGTAEQLPWADAMFDAALAQLVLSFVSDAGQAVREMRRVVRPGGTVGACMWLEGDGMQLTSLFWEAAGALEPGLRDMEAKMPFRKPGDIGRLFDALGLGNVQETTLEVSTTYQSFDELWGTLEHAAGPVGAYMARADAELRAAIRTQYHHVLGQPVGHVELFARAAVARASV